MALSMAAYSGRSNRSFRDLRRMSVGERGQSQSRILPMTFMVATLGNPIPRTAMMQIENTPMLGVFSFLAFCSFEKCAA
jgi:hypothetical protein